jgi:hypothetical protein
VVKVRIAVSVIDPVARSRQDARRSIEIERNNLLSDPCTYGLEEIARDTDDQIRDAELCSASHRPQAFAATGTVKNNVHFSSPRLEIETPKPSCVAYGEVAIADAVDFRTMAGIADGLTSPSTRPTYLCAQRMDSPPPPPPWGAWVPVNTLRNAGIAPARCFTSHRPFIRDCCSNHVHTE